MTKFNEAIVLLCLPVIGCNYDPISNREKAKQYTAKLQVQSFLDALGQYRRDVGHYPTSAEGLAVLWTNQAGVSGWAGPYLERIPPLDPWGNAYIYRYSEKNGVEIMSRGADGELGGSGDDSDIKIQSDTKIKN